MSSLDFRESVLTPWLRFDGGAFMVLVGGSMVHSGTVVFGIIVGALGLGALVDLFWPRKTVERLKAELDREKERVAFWRAVFQKSNNAEEEPDPVDPPMFLSVFTVAPMNGVIPFQCPECDAVTILQLERSPEPIQTEPVTLGDVAKYECPVCFNSYDLHDWSRDDDGLFLCPNGCCSVPDYMVPVLAAAYDSAHRSKENA